MSEIRVSTRRTRRVYGVGELLAGLNALLEDRVGRVWVVGEVSNLHRAHSGHSYFTLKDEGGQVRAALFRSAATRVPFELEEGLEVVVHGDVGVYEARGDLQLIVRQVEPRGQGALQLALEQLRVRLEAEGLFDDAHKQPLPAMPGVVGVVTSATSAAIRDVIHVSGRRFPGARLVISPTRVQGEGAENEVAAALDLLVDHGEAEVVLLVRGGGSLEDLWAFNTEVVARAIARCPIPLVSGVGHETDTTIADWVADVRAPTPSAAAEIALPDRSTLLRELGRDGQRLVAALQSQLGRARARFDRERDALKVLAPRARMAARRMQLHSLQRALRSQLESVSGTRRAALAELVAQLEALSPLAVLSRGYALVRREGDGGIVRAASQVEAGDAIEIRLSEGEVRATVLPPKPPAE